MSLFTVRRRRTGVVGLEAGFGLSVDARDDRQSFRPGLRFLCAGLPAIVCARKRFFPRGESLLYRQRRDIYGRFNYGWRV
ncbi:MAG: hypothetical protein ACRDV3_07645 [Acidothermaceae bacterium]